ncbi:hypothetical protein CDL15_Pgr024626 [Punica granatum]|uniref:Uncharacterized protein n=1 Tax=Punica granatum TaxID=22663 RepID=A0A218VSR4_PUNGR|nr:hypothetical protein CDL15_Pgr024626 [Punica granatum]PKI67244.1 hypothetical protein CRG98_012385 [Punica granatum]
MKYTTALGAKQASNKAQPSQQQSWPSAKHNCPSSKADLRQSTTTPAASLASDSPTCNDSSNETGFLQIKRTATPRARYRKKQLHPSGNADLRQISTFGIASALHIQRTPPST